ncbi:MAG: hypothetical protein FJW96_16270, partial [Actinobacteria bacterium]|nr:hypothetical protein [Actinomycetota bacterium]
NRAAGFSPDPSHPNAIGPGRRPFHTIIPGMLLEDGGLLGPFGSRRSVAWSTVVTWCAAAMTWSPGGPRHGRGGQTGVTSMGDARHPGKVDHRLPRRERAESPTRLRETTQPVRRDRGALRAAPAPGPRAAARARA